jgi:cell division ATPase FtsA
MSLFSKKKSERIGAIIDIGSGSVLVAIVASSPEKAAPTIIWHHREHAPLRVIESLEQSAKSVLTALMNAVMQLDSEGRKTLYAYQKHARITDVQCTIAAPWSYTVTKTISYNRPEPFEITHDIVMSLVAQAEKQITDELQNFETARALGLTIITKATMDLLANGYRIKHPYGEKAQDVTLSHASVVTQQYLVEELTSLQEKMFPSTTLYKLSQMLAYYCVAKQLIPKIHDFTLINITYEASELGIVRNGTLQYVTHTPFGSFSLAREISAITSVPLYEAFQYLHEEEPLHFMERLTDTQKAAVEAVFDAYVDRLAGLFKETGDDLTIPKRILLHTNLRSEPLFLKLVERATKRDLKTTPEITLVTAELASYFDNNAIKNNPDVDTAMLMVITFFHTQNCNGVFEYT